MKKYKIVISIIILLGTLLVFYTKDDLAQALNLNISKTEEYVKHPKTLEEWQQINPNVVMVLEFTSDGILHNIPVLEVDNGDNYMKKNIWGEYDTMGSVFIEKEISPVDSSNNWIINGHSSYSKDWNFTFLKKYTSKDYFDKNGTFTIEDKYGYHTFKIVSFAEYDFALGEEKLNFDWFNNKFKSIQEVVDMFKISKEYILQRRSSFNYKGQQMITIVTCNMKKEDSRYVLMAIEEKN